MRYAVPALFGILLGIITTVPVRAQGAGDSIPESGRIEFRVVREDVDIGKHTLTFRKEGDKLVVDVAIDLNVTFLGMSVYRYLHRARETWRNGRLIAMETATDNNGEPYKVSVQAGEGGLVVITGSGQAIFPPEAFPSSHWNRAWLAAPLLINTQKGDRIAFTATSRGMESVATAAGPMQAEHFALTGGLRKDIWFDARGRWVKSRFDAPDGSSIQYVLQ